jgi:hypothetical protein
MLYTMPNRIHDLIIKQLKGKLTTEERLELDEFKARSNDNKEVVEKLTDPQYLLKAIPASRKVDVDAAWRRVNKKKIRQRPFPQARKLWRSIMSWIASILLCKINK